MPSNRDSVQERLARLGIRIDSVQKVAAKHHAYDISVFGSVLTDSFSETSDIDLLVSFRDGASYFDLLNLQSELEALADRKVDVISRNGLSKFIGPEILREAIGL